MNHQENPEEVGRVGRPEKSIFFQSPLLETTSGATLIETYGFLQKPQQFHMIQPSTLESPQSVTHDSPSLSYHMEFPLSCSLTWAQATAPKGACFTGHSV